MIFVLTTTTVNNNDNDDHTTDYFTPCACARGNYVYISAVVQERSGHEASWRWLERHAGGGRETMIQFVALSDLRISWKLASIHYIEGFLNLSGFP